MVNDASYLRGDLLRSQQSLVRGSRGSTLTGNRFYEGSFGGWYEDRFSPAKAKLRVSVNVILVDTLFSAHDPLSPAQTNVHYSLLRNLIAESKRTTVVRARGEKKHRKLTHNRTHDTDIRLTTPPPHPPHKKGTFTSEMQFLRTHFGVCPADTYTYILFPLFILTNSLVTMEIFHLPASPR